MNIRTRKIAGTILFIIGIMIWIFVLSKPSGSIDNKPLAILLVLAAISIIAGTFIYPNFGKSEMQLPK